jgi:hypothetical protein
VTAPFAVPPTARLRPEAENAPSSGIVEAMTYGRGRPGLIPLWAGEGDMPTPAFICEAATRSLAAGETFYTWQRGIPELRQALAASQIAKRSPPIMSGSMGAPSTSSVSSSRSAACMRRRSGSASSPAAATRS